MSSDPGTERTIDAGETLRAEPLQVAGQLNLAGEAQIAPADLAAAGAAAATPQPELVIAPTETVTVGPRSTRKGEPVEIGGQLNIAGQLEVTPGGAALDAETDAAASGTADATGTASVDTELLLAAAGVAEATGAGSVSFTRTLAAAGIADATGTAGLTAAQSLAAAGTADTAGTATLDAARALAAAGVADTDARALLSSGEPVPRFSRSSLAWQEDEEIALDTEAGGSVD